MSRKSFPHLKRLDYNMPGTKLVPLPIQKKKNHFLSSKASLINVAFLAILPYEKQCMFMLLTSC